MVRITRSLYWSWSLAQDTRVFLQPPEVYIWVPLSVDIHTSLAGGFYVPVSRLFHFSFHFLTSMCQYHRLISALHAFATSHHASYFGSREIGSVQKESTGPYTFKTNHPPKSRLSHVYTMTLPFFRLRATIHLPAQLSACPAYLCALCVRCAGLQSSTFCVLGSWDFRDISSITPPSMLLPLHMSCLFGFTVL